MLSALLTILGSIMSVNMADTHAPGKQSRFVGICIDRGGHGLRAHFTLRNVVDGQGWQFQQHSEVYFLHNRPDCDLPLHTQHRLDGSRLSFRSRTSV